MVKRKIKKKEKEKEADGILKSILLLNGYNNK